MSEEKGHAIRVVKSYPPNIDKIRAVLDIHGMPDIMFTYGWTIYNPGGKPVPSELIAHEEIHAQNQAKIGVDVWWDKYLADPKFRLDEEILSYQVQWKVMGVLNYARSYKRKVLRMICKELAGRMYGNLCSAEEAKRLITEKSE